MTQPQLFHCLRYRDADAAIAFLVALGFTERLVVRDELDPTVVVHAQFQWRDNGGLMFGSVRDDAKGLALRPGTGVCNLVVESDEAVDATLRRAVEAGGRIAQEPNEPPHGGRSAGVLDPEGNYWNIDSHPGQ
ncbi:VOC family protein [Mobilicoccus massiliensis]|uniref:VOC family protein n=1 Tax=Mobilicoccus massiliensis TaxID=1522310 RepID=UPI00058C701A|nr:VOC family protein [Mobilicoccus massiliensis]